MFPRLIKSFLLAFVLLALAILPAQAGGWAVVTLDSWPIQPGADQSFQIGFTIRQHGRTPWVYDDVVVHAVHEASHTTLEIPATMEGQPGHYAARLELPHPGVWRWGVASGLAVPVQWMPDLNVPAAVARAESAAPNVPALWVAAGGALLALGSLLLQHRIRRALPLAFIASGICIAGFAAAFYPLVVPSKTLAFAPLPAVEVKEAGEALFMAKGCVVCHTHVRVSLPANQMMHIDMGAPDLTNYRLGEEYLRLWLSDPAAVKPETEMPNLELSPAEIDALVTFLMVTP